VSRPDSAERLAELLPAPVRRDLVAALEEAARRHARRPLPIVLYFDEAGRVLGAELTRWSGVA